MVFLQESLWPQDLFDASLLMVCVTLCAIYAVTELPPVVELLAAAVQQTVAQLPQEGDLMEAMAHMLFVVAR